MSDNFWDTVNAEPEGEGAPPAVVPEPIEPLAPFSLSSPREPRTKYTASLSDFPVSVWDSENDAREIIDWFNEERKKQGRRELDFEFFQRTTDVHSFDSKNDARQFLELALDILNDHEGRIENQSPGSWAATDPQWMKEYEKGAVMWANMAAAVGFTVVLIFGVVSGLLVSVALSGEWSGRDWPTAEAQIIEFDEWIETSCGDDGCSDTQYARASFELHCTFDVEADEFVCGGIPHENADTVLFEHSYNSGFFEHAPVHYMLEHLTDSETHTVAYNPNDPSQVDLRPGFQINWEWFIPIVIPMLFLIGISKAGNVSVKDGMKSLRAMMKGELEV